MTPEQTIAAIYLSILSSPAKIGLYDNIGRDPLEIKSRIKESECIIQEHIAGFYGRDPIKASESIAEKCYSKSISVVVYNDDGYPPLLREIHRPPVVLYTKGNLSFKKTVSIVGTRNSDRISEDITLKISSSLSDAGYSIVSGMAYGIDRFAHLGALNSGGKTIGILPGGIDTIYPYRNRDIYKMISESGVSGLISEYPPGIQSGQKWTFAQRNRIISGISPALVVIQAPKGSGAMITARYAIEQNRDVFVCSGHAFDENYGGCHELIRDGASIVSQVEDILSVIDPEYKMAERGSGSETSGKTGEILINTGRVTVEKQVKPDFSLYTGIERDLLESVFSGITDIDLFTRKHSFSPDTVLRAITALEIEGVITRKGNKIVMK